jgi:hypothetical protein
VVRIPFEDVLSNAGVALVVVVGFLAILTQRDASAKPPNRKIEGKNTFGFCRNTGIDMGRTTGVLRCAWWDACADRRQTRLQHFSFRDCTNGQHPRERVSPLGNTRRFVSFEGPSLIEFNKSAHNKDVRAIITFNFVVSIVVIIVFTEKTRNKTLKIEKISI